MHKTSEALALIDIAGLADMLKVSERTIWRMVADRLIPSPIRVGKKNPRWPLSQIGAWIEAGCPAQSKEAQ